MAFGLSGVATYAADHGRGIAGLLRDPARTTRSYLSRATPLGAIADTAEALLTFAPGNVAGAAGGRAIRVAAEEYARDPHAWIAARRVVHGSDEGVADLSAFLRRDPIHLADGRLMQPPDAAAIEGFSRWYDALPPSRLRVRGIAEEYQVQVYGSRERVVLARTDAGDVPTSPTTTGPVKPASVSDGATDPWAAIGDAKHRGKGTSFYDPASLSPTIRQIAVRRMDTTLLKYQHVVNSDGPVRAVEIVTNDPAAAAFVESRC